MHTDGTALARAWQRWLACRPRTAHLGVLLGALAVYLLTAHWDVPQNSDALVAALPAHQLFTQGTLDLSGSYSVDELPGLVARDGRLVVARTMGVVLAGLPGAALLAWTGASAAMCGSLSAALWSAAAVANVHAALRSFVRPGAALLGATALALGTGLWTTASVALWTHGPDAFWLSLTLLLVSRERWWLAGAALVPAIWTRPHLAVVAAVLGLWLAGRLRRWAPLWGIGLPSLSGVPVLVGWNAWYYGAPSLGGQYGYAVPNVTRPLGDGGPLFAENLAGVLVSPLSGLLVFSPVVAAGLWAAASTRLRSPAWAEAAAVAALVYLVVQMRISSSYLGGSSYYGNRYGIEPLVLAAPLLTSVLVRWARAGSWRRVVALSSLTVSCTLHAFGALVPASWVSIGYGNPWTTWYPLLVARQGGAQVVVAALTCLAVLVLGVALALQDRRRGLVPPASPDAVARVEELAA